MQTILSSINDRFVIEIDYTSADEKQTKRSLEGVGISYVYPFWYLTAWCHLRKGYRFFRLDRIDNIKITTDQFTKEHPPLESLSGVHDPKSFKEVVLHTSRDVSIFHADKCKYMGLAKEKELENGKIEQTYQVFSFESIARWVLANADTTTIVHPDEAKDVIRQIIKNLDL